MPRGEKTLIPSVQNRDLAYTSENASLDRLNMIRSVAFAATKASPSPLVIASRRCNPLPHYSAQMLMMRLSLSQTTSNTPSGTCFQG